MGLIGSIDGLEPITPHGGFYLFIDCSGLIGKRTPSGGVLRTDEDVTLYLLDVAGVAVIQGSAYGSSPYFRISFATSIEQHRAGLSGHRRCGVEALRQAHIRDRAR